MEHQDDDLPPPELLVLCHPPPALASAIKLPSGTLLRRVQVGPFHDYYRTKNDLVVVASIDTEDHGALLHVSVSWAQRVPTWAELRDVQVGMAGSLPMMMLLPRPWKYINNHPYVLNMYQVPDAWLPALTRTPQGEIQVTGTLSDGTKVVADEHQTMWLIGKNGVPPAWELIKEAREAALSMSIDVLVTWDGLRSIRPNLGMVRLAYTPEPWEGGQAIGDPRLTTEQMRRMAHDEARRGALPRTGS